MPRRPVGARPILLAAAAGAYVVAAWMVAPGFYDGITPSQPYNFVCPAVPGADSGVKPSSGHLDFAVINGVSDANSGYTADGQLVVGFLPGAFDATGMSKVSVDIRPISPCPQPGGIHFVTNTYLVTANALMVKGANLVLVYSNLELDPSYVYHATSPDGPGRTWVLRNKRSSGRFSRPTHLESWDISPPDIRRMPSRGMVQVAGRCFQRRWPC